MHINFIESVRAERDSLTARLEALNHFLAAYEGKEEETKPAVRRGSKKVRRQVTCSTCGRPGHTAKTCGRVGTAPVPKDEPEEKDDDGISRPGEDVEYNDVQELKERGFDQLRAAAKLHTTLGVIKRHWD